MQNSTKTWQEEEQQFINQSANDINKELGKTWQEEFDDIFGENHHKICVGKNCECHKVVKQFISDLIAQTREETIREEIAYWTDVFDNRPTDRDLESDIIAQNFARIEIERLENKLK